MFIKFCPQRNDNQKIYYKKIDENTISINGEEVYFNPNFIEYDTENINEIINAYRDENNNLCLLLLYYYSKDEKNIWENPTYYDEGGFRGSKYEDFTNLPNGSDII